MATVLQEPLAPTDEYYEAEKEYSMQSEINEITEWKRFNTDTAIETLQRGWLPQWLDDIRWNQYDTYFRKNEYVISRNYFESCINITGIVDTIFHDERNQRFIEGNLIDLNYFGHISPFLLFLENEFIPWERIYVVKSDQHVSLLIKDRDKEIPIKKLDILSLPMQIEYNDSGYSYNYGTNLFMFDENGHFTLDEKPKWCIMTSDKSIHQVTMKGKFNMRDLGLDDTRRYLASNFLTFDNDGKLYRECVCRSDNPALTTIDSTNDVYMCLVYSVKSNLNESVIMRAEDRAFIRDMLRDKHDNPPYDKYPPDSPKIKDSVKDLIKTKFDFWHDKKFSYNENISHSILTTFWTDQNKYDKVFEKIKNVDIFEYDIKKIKQRIADDIAAGGDGSITMLRDVYDDKQYETYVIIFINGLANSECNNGIIYRPDNFTFKIPDDVPVLESLTIVYFRRIRNELIPIVNIYQNTKSNPPKCLGTAGDDYWHPDDVADNNYHAAQNVLDYYIPKDDIVLYSDWLGYEYDVKINDDKTIHDVMKCFGTSETWAKNYLAEHHQLYKEPINLFPLNKEIDDDGNIILHEPYPETTKNPYYKYGNWFIGSRNQFIHQRFVIDDNIVHLGYKFKTAYDSRRFMVFDDGHFVNSASYRVMIPRYSLPNITERCIYFRFKPGEKKILDVYYLPSDGMNPDRLESEGDLYIWCLHRYADKEGQMRFKVPYPYPDYPHIYDAFFLVKNDRYVDKSRYVFDGDYIKFTDPRIHFKQFESLMFVFPLYGNAWDDDIENVGLKDQMKFIPYHSRTKYGDTTINFTYDWRGVPKPDRAHYLFFGTTFVEPNRYTLNADGSITLKNGEYMMGDILVTLVVETDQSSQKLIDSNIILSTYEIETPPGADCFEYDLPEPDFWNSFFITRGSVLVSRNRYEVVAPDHKTIRFLNMNDWQPDLSWDTRCPQDEKNTTNPQNGRHLCITFMKHKDDHPELVTNDGALHIITDSQHYRFDHDVTKFQIDKDYFKGFKYSDDNVMIFVNGAYWPAENRWHIDSNQILELKNPLDVIPANSNIDIIFAYQLITYFKPNRSGTNYTNNGNANQTNIGPKDQIFFNPYFYRVTGGNKTHIPLTYDYKGIPNPNDKAYMTFINSTFVDQSRYTMNADGSLDFFNSNLDVPDGSHVTMLSITEKLNTDCNKNSNVMATSYILETPAGSDQYLYELPEPDFYDAFFITRGSILVSPHRYELVEPDKRYIRFLNTTDLQPDLSWDSRCPQKSPNGRHLQITYIKYKDDIAGKRSQYGTNHISLKFQFYRPTTDVQELQLYNSYFNGFTYTENNMLLFVNGTYWPPGVRWHMEGNQKVVLNNPKDYIYAESNVTVMYAYQNPIYDSPTTNIKPTDREIIYFTDVFLKDRPKITAKPEVDAATKTMKFPIPWIHPPFTDTPFFLSYKDQLDNSQYGIFIPEYQWEITHDRKYVVIKPDYFDYYNSIITDPEKLRFTFVHNKSFTGICKYEASVDIHQDQVVFDIPTPYHKRIELFHKFFVTADGDWLDGPNDTMDHSDYDVDSINNRLMLKNFNLNKYKKLNFYFFYTSNSANGAIGYLPESGYVSFYRENIDRNFNKEMMMMFVNGKLVQKSELMDVSNNLKKVKVDIHRRYDLAIISTSPLISQFKSWYRQRLPDGYFKRDTWTQILDSFEINDDTLRNLTPYT